MNATSLPTPRSSHPLPKYQKLLSVDEAAQMTGRKASTWRRDILLKRILYVKLGRQVRIPLEVINEMITKGEVKPVQLSKAAQ